MARGRPTLIIGIAIVLAILLLLAVVYLLGRRSAGGGAPLSSAAQQAVATEAPPTAAPAEGATSPPTPPTITTGGGGRTPTPPTGQTIVAFNVPATFNCGASPAPSGYLIHLSWTTLNASGVSISIDEPGKFADYPANGSADLPFACSEVQHTYLLTTRGSGTSATKTVVVKRAK